MTPESCVKRLLDMTNRVTGTTDYLETIVRKREFVGSSNTQMKAIEI